MKKQKKLKKIQKNGLTKLFDYSIILLESEEQKMTKKQMKAKNNKNRVLVPFNTGTRTMKSAKYPTRQENKKNFKKMLDNY